MRNASQGTYLLHEPTNPSRVQIQFTKNFKFPLIAPSELGITSSGSPSRILRLVFRGLSCSAHCWTVVRLRASTTPHPVLFLPLFF